MDLIAMFHLAYRPHNIEANRLQKHAVTPKHEGYREYNPEIGQVCSSSVFGYKLCSYSTTPLKGGLFSGGKLRPL